jgi:hypothetical protein
MKKLLACILSFMISSTAIADVAHIRLNITNPVKENTYFVCLYEIGCLSIRAGNRGKVFAAMPANMGNILKIVIVDFNTMRMYRQTNVPSCQVNLREHQTLTISGQLVVNHSIPHINNLHCSMK